MRLHTILVASLVSAALAFTAGCASSDDAPDAFPVGGDLAQGAAGDEGATPDEGEPDIDTDKVQEVGEGEFPGGRTFDVNDLATSDVREGDTIMSGNVGVIVPPKGMVVTINAEMLDGPPVSFGISHNDDGTITVPMDMRIDSGGSGPSECADSAYNTLGHKWYGTLEWRIRTGRQTSTNSFSPSAVQAIREGAANMANGRNNCGMSGNPSAAQKFLGSTKRSTNIISNAKTHKCGVSDTHNVVGFGLMPENVLASACTWSWQNKTPWKAATSDIKFNDDHAWYSAEHANQACRYSFTFEGVATHEFGHVFGLDHVGEKGHGEMTMSTATSPCSSTSSTLGRGDLLGLRKLYGN